MRLAWLALIVTLGVSLVACRSTKTGPAGYSLPPHLVSVSPVDGTTISRDEIQADGITANFKFQVGNGLGRFPSNQIRLYVNMNDVSIKLRWTMTKDLPPSEGSFKFVPDKPMSPGWKTLRIIYWDMVDNVPYQRYDYVWRINVTK